MEEGMNVQATEVESYSFLEQASIEKLLANIIIKAKNKYPIIHSIGFKKEFFVSSKTNNLDCNYSLEFQINVAPDQRKFYPMRNWLVENFTNLRWRKAMDPFTASGKMIFCFYIPSKKNFDGGFNDIIDNIDAVNEMFKDMFLDETKYKQQHLRREKP